MSVCQAPYGVFFNLWYSLTMVDQKLSRLFNKVFEIKPFEISEGSRFFNNRDDDEPKKSKNKYSIKTRNAKIPNDGTE